MEAPIPMPAKEIKLFDYQLESVAKAMEYLAKSVNPLLVCPTGAGKTFIACEIIRRWQQANGGKRAVFVAHRKELISQAADAAKLFGIDMVTISVFSEDFSEVTEEEKATSLVVFDEAHHAVASSWVAFSEVFRGPKVAVTATPDRLDQQKLESVGFEKAYEISIRTLIDKGRLVRPMAYRMPVEMSTAMMRGRDEAVAALATAIVDTVRRFERKKTMVFMPDVESSRRMTSALREAGISAGHADGSSAKLRAHTVDNFKNGDLDVLLNVNLFTEGFDCPAVDCVVILAETQSLARLSQIIGRGLRAHPGKEDCLIVDPLWISGKNVYSPADVFTTHPAAKARKPDVSGGYDVLGEADIADRDAETTMLERIAREERKQAHKEAAALGLVDLSTAVAVFGFVLPHDESSMGITEAQKAILASFGVHAPVATTAVTAYQADWVIGRLRHRQALQLATVKQVRKLRQFGHRSPERLSVSQASAAISRDWRMRR